MPLRSASCSSVRNSSRGPAPPSWAAATAVARSASPLSSSPAKHAADHREREAVRFCIETDLPDPLGVLRSVQRDAALAAQRRGQQPLRPVVAHRVDRDVALGRELFDAVLHDRLTLRVIARTVRAPWRRPRLQPSQRPRWIRSWRWDSNPRPSDYKSLALPDCATPALRHRTTVGRRRPASGRRPAAGPQRRTRTARPRAPPTRSANPRGPGVGIRHQQVAPLPDEPGDARALGRRARAPAGAPAVALRRGSSPALVVEPDRDEPRVPQVLERSRRGSSPGPTGRCSSAPADARIAAGDSPARPPVADDQQRDARRLRRTRARAEVLRVLDAVEHRPERVVGGTAATEVPARPGRAGGAPWRRPPDGRGRRPRRAPGRGRVRSDPARDGGVEQLTSPGVGLRAAAAETLTDTAAPERSASRTARRPPMTKRSCGRSVIRPEPERG